MLLDRALVRLLHRLQTVLADLSIVIDGDYAVELSRARAAESQRKLGEIRMRTYYANRNGDDRERQP